MSADQNFKNVIMHANLLPKLLGEWVEELKGKDEDYIRRCLRIEDGGTQVIGRSNEYASGLLGPVLMDVVFDVTLPGKEGIKVIVDIEGQKISNPSYRIESRAAYYVSRMISDQKGKEFTGSDYDGICKCYSIWVILRPDSKNGSSAVRYHTVGEYLNGYESDRPIPECDLTEILVITIGGPDAEAPTEMMGVLSTVFAKGLDPSEKSSRLKNKFKIDVDDVLLTGLKGISMTMEQEYREYLISEGYKQGLEKGLEEGIEQGLERGFEQGRSETEASIVSSFVDNVRKKTISSEISLETVLEIVPEEIRDEVRKKLEESS